MIYLRYHDFEVIYTIHGPCMDFDNILLMDYEIYNFQNIFYGFCTIPLEKSENKLFLRQFFETRLKECLLCSSPLLNCSLADRARIRKIWTKQIKYFDLVPKNYSSQQLKFFEDVKQTY